MLQAASLEAEQRILRVQARNLLVACTQNFDRFLYHGNAVHGSFGTDQEVCEEARDSLNLATDGFAFLIQEVELVDDRNLAIDSHEVVRICGLAGVYQECQEAKI